MPARPPQDEPVSYIEERVIEMQWTQELVKAEMDYRQHVALRGAELEHVRAARRAHPSMWKRLRWHN